MMAKSKVMSGQYLYQTPGLCALMLAKHDSQHAAVTAWEGSGHTKPPQPKPRCYRSSLTAR